MTNRDLLTEAFGLALDTHWDQTDKAGRPYITHVLRVTARMNSPIEQAVALLHDVMEDGALTRNDLSAFPLEVVDAVEALSRRLGEEYEDFILRVKNNSLARAVKIADLSDNLDPERRLPDSEKYIDRYSKAIKLLRDDYHVD